MSIGENAAPYGAVIRVAKAYEESRRALGFDSYKAFKWEHDPMEQKNWIHFQRTADLMISSGCQDEDEWIRAQFRAATREVYPYPTNLYSENAVKKYLDSAVGETENGRVMVQNGWLAQYRQLFPERTDTEIVMNPFWAFDSWFRVLYAESVPVTIAAAAEKELRQSSSLRKAIIAAGIDLTNLEKKVQSYLR